MHKLKISLTNDMLNQLNIMRESMERQSDVISEAAEKFNNVLLQIECCGNTNAQHDTSENQVLCSYSKTLNNNLTKVIENAVNLLPKMNTTPNNDNLPKYLQLIDDEAEYLENNIRKLLVLSDIVKQMIEMRKALEIDDMKNP